jgi:hypothetical protein
MKYDKNSVFTHKQVAKLWQYQFGPWAKPFDRNSPLPQRFHPFTCPNRGDGNHFENGEDLGILVPTVSGFICPCCSYMQTWAHPFMMGEENRVATRQEIQAAMNKTEEDNTK